MKEKSVFEKRVPFKPYEYPEILEYKDKINQCYWLITEFGNFSGDIQDFSVSLNFVEKSVVRKTLLAISQIEVAVKKFWVKLGERFPKAEFDMVGITFGESEIRHSESYAHLLQILGLNDDFEGLLKVPAIKGRIDYLQKYLSGASSKDDEVYALTLTLFSIFIENVSLFSQFAIIKSFNKHKKVLKDIESVIQATQKEELVHALFGVYLINLIKKEHPEWFNEEFYEKINKACLKSFKAESEIIDWIFEEGEVDFINIESLKEFIRSRFNDSIKMIGGNKPFRINKEKLKDFQWFEDEIYLETRADFFHKRPSSYSKGMKSITEEDLF